jgi:biotin transport system substrate-specific component
MIISLCLLFFIAPYKIELKGETPVTLQTLIILFCAIGFSWRIGLPAVLIYVAAGALGAKVFAGYSSGMDSITGPYGGFIFGFIAASVVCGYLAEQEAFSKPIPAILNWFLGHTIIILLGSVWLMKLDPQWKSRINDMLPGALIKSATGALIIQLIIKFMQFRTRKFTGDGTDLPQR